jgi:hypothetical protein
MRNDLETRPADNETTLALEAAWLYDLPRSKGQACDLIAGRVSKPSTPDPAEIIDRACEQVKERLKAEESVREADTSSV